MPPKKKADAEPIEENKSSPSKKPRAKKKSSEIFTTRNPTPHRPTSSDRSRLLKVVSWNVDGLRAPGRLDDLAVIVANEAPDLLVLQETKLQAPWTENWQAAMPGYDAYWSHSSDKKGYAGTVAFLRAAAPGTPSPSVLGAGDVTLAGDEEKEEGDKGAPSKGSKKKKQAGKGNIASFFTKPPKGGKAATEEEEETPAAAEEETAKPAKEEKKEKPEAAESTSTTGRDEASGHFGPRALSVRFGLKGDGNKEHNGEGRCVTVEYEQVAIVALYVPNSGQQLERLSYRLEKWNPSLQGYVKDIESSGKPVVVTGDLNVAHTDLDAYNPYAPHLKKQAGCTIEERQAHTVWLQQGYVDAFRYCHGAVQGAYTYWSTRASNRPENKGLRLDYFICSQSLAEGVLPAPINEHDQEVEPAVMVGGNSEAESSASSDDPCAPAKYKIGDCYCLPETTKSSDHCPVSLVLEER